MKNVFSACWLLAYVAAGSAMAQTGTTPTGAITDASKVPSAGEGAKVGDNFIFRQPLEIFRPYDPAKPSRAEAQPAGGSQAPKPSSDLRCAPVDSWAKVLGVPSAQDGNYYVIFPSEKWYELHVASGGLPGLSPSIPKDTTPKDAASKEVTAACPLDKRVSGDVTYRVDKDSLNNIYASRFGVTYGALVVPFKWHFNDHAIDSSSAILGYVGYQGWWTGGSSAVVVAAGLSTVNVPDTAATAQGGTSGTTAKAALTAAIGVNWTFGTTQLWKGGVLVGWDWAGKSSGYQYEYHPWLAVSLGLGF